MSGHGLQQWKQFYLNASDGCLHEWHRTGEDHLVECICWRHTGPSPGLKAQDAINYTFSFTFGVCVGNTEQSSVHAEYLSPVLLSLLQQEVMCCSNRIMLMCMNLNLLSKTCNNFPGQHDLWTRLQLSTCVIRWDENWHMQLVCLQHLQNCVNRSSRHGIMYPQGSSGN